MSDANQRLLEASDSVARASSNWQVMSKVSQEANLQRWIKLEAHFAKLHRLSALSFSSLQTVNLANLGLKLGLDNVARMSLANVHIHFSSDYQEFFRAVTRHHTDEIAIPESLTELPAVEYLNQTALIASTAGGEIDAEVEEAVSDVQQGYAAENNDDLTELLNDLNPQLPVLLLGARTVIETQHADYVRHFATSLRELLTQVLHLLAPDDHLRAWSTDPSDYHNGRPTRRARIRYITRNVHDFFGGFLITDVDAVLEFLDAFQKGTHALQPGFTPTDVLDLKIRMEGLLRLLLVVNARRW